MGTYLPGTEPWALGADVGLGLVAPELSLPYFYPLLMGVAPAAFASVPPTCLDGCGFFNSTVVRLPFNSISDGSEWWLFDILVVILI